MWMHYHLAFCSLTNFVQILKTNLRDLFTKLHSIIMQVAIIFAALFAVASAGVLTGPTLLAAPAPIAIAHAPVLRAAPVLHSAPIGLVGHPALTRTVIAGPGLAVAHHAPIGLVQPTIIG